MNIGAFARLHGRSACVAATSLILLTSLGGTTYPWRSAPIYILGMAGAA